MGRERQNNRVDAYILIYLGVGVEVGMKSRVLLCSYKLAAWIFRFG